MLYIELILIIAFATLLLFFAGRMFTKSFYLGMSSLEPCLRQVVISAYHKTLPYTFRSLAAAIIISLGAYALYLMSAFGIEHSAAVIFSDDAPLVFRLIPAFVTGHLVGMFLVISVRSRTFVERLNWALVLKKNCEKMVGTIANIRTVPGNVGLYLTIRDKNGETKELYLDADMAADFRPSDFKDSRTTVFYRNCGSVSDDIIFLAPP